MCSHLEQPSVVACLAVALLSFLALQAHKHNTHAWLFERITDALDLIFLENVVKWWVYTISNELGPDSRAS